MKAENETPQCQLRLDTASQGPDSKQSQQQSGEAGTPQVNAASQQLDTGLPPYSESIY